MRELIRDLAARGITVLLSSHLLVEVEELIEGDSGAEGAARIAAAAAELA